MSERLWDYIFKILDALTSLRTLATVAVVLMLIWRSELGLDDDTIKLLTVTVVGWVISDGQRATSRPVALFSRRGNDANRDDSGPTDTGDSAGV